MSGKLYLVTRADLRHGSQAAQLVHGMATFARHHPAIFEHWERVSNTVVCLAVADEDSLHELLIRANHLSDNAERNLAVSSFFEPDFDDQLTCVVLEPAVTFQNMCKGLRLACC